MKKKASRFFIVEARRLIPLVFLLVLLLGLTVYDNFFRVEPTAGGPDAFEEGIAFTTTDWGPLTSPTSFAIAATHDKWTQLSREKGLSLPDYPFNAAEELAVFAVNSEIQGMQIIPRFEEVVVQVLVEPKDNYYHVVTVDRKAVDHEQAVWKFVDQENKLLNRIVPFWHETEEEDEEGEEEEEEEVEK